MSKVLTDQIEKRTGGTAMDVPTSGKWPQGNIADNAIGNTQMADDAVGVAELSATGTASATTFLRGDNAWTAVDTSGINANKEDIALLAFKTQANGNLARYNLVDQFVDAFEDASGINAGASTNELRDAAGKYYSGSIENPVTATGGTITTDGNYTIHSFTSTGTYTTDTAQVVDLLVVAGGGGGGGYCGGGGGAGGYISTIGHNLTAAAHTATVGTAGGGGSGGPPGGAGGNGNNSQFGSMTAAVGGGGGRGYNTGSAGNGGSGGGSTTGTVGTGTPGQGFAGGQGTEASSQGGGGGGGASEVGGNSSVDGVSPNNFGGPGGDGLSNSITGTATYYAGGGGGGRGGVSTTPQSAGTGGLGGGGTGSSGANSPNTATAGTNGTGGGGGGGGHPHTGGQAGGSGIVILRRPTDESTYDNMTLISNSTTAEAQPTKADVVLTYTNGAGTATINTDLIASVSRDGGTTYTAATLVNQGTTGGHTILTTNDLDISGQPAGTSMIWKVATANQSISKQTRIHAVSLGWS